MQPHPAANLFPLITGEDFEALKADIRANGQLEPIWTYQGQILDGRNRYRACVDLGLEPLTREWNGEGSLVQFVLSLNLHRRHLSSSQRAVVALEVLPMLEEEARARQSAAGGDNRDKALDKLFYQAVERGPQSIDTAAQLVGTNRQYVSDAKAIATKAPELLEQVKEGTLTLPEAKRELKAQALEAKRAEELKPEPPIPAASRFNPQPGDVWRLGQHTLHCGDYFGFPHVAADALITDPPYGIDYDPSWKKADGSDSDFRKIEGDGQEFDPRPFLDYPTVLLFGANYYTQHLPQGGWLCWDKRTKDELDSMFGSPFELAWYRSVNTNRRAIMVRVLHGGVINADSEKGLGDRRSHPTQKPVMVFTEIINQLTQPGDIILEPFAGSGTTLIACERTKRICMAYEIDMEYCKVILSRYEAETGETPWLVSSE